MQQREKIAASEVWWWVSGCNSWGREMADGEAVRWKDSVNGWGGKNGGGGSAKELVAAAAEVWHGDREAIEMEVAEVWHRWRSSSLMMEVH